MYTYIYIHTYGIYVYINIYGIGFPKGSAVKNLPASVADECLIPGLGRSPGKGNGKPLQYSCLESPMDRGASLATVHRVATSQTRLSL